MAKRRIDTRRPDIKAALAAGWIYIGKTGGCHLRFEHPGTSTPMFLASSPSDHRGAKNAVAWIRRNTPPTP